MKLILALACVACVLAQTPPRPMPSETFEAFTQMEIAFNDTNGQEQRFIGQGQFAKDQKGQKSLERYEFWGHHEMDVFNLQRFDLGFFYHVNVTEQTCNATKLSANQTMPTIWDWLHIANYSGQIAHFNEVLELWEADLGYARLGLAVRKGQENIPVWMRRRGPQREANVFFHRFFPNTPPANFFNVPGECKNPNATNWQAASPIRRARNVGCVDRSGMVSRGQAWVNAHVPYNQGATYEGYREDCSGFVSMTWQTSKPGYVTSTIPQIAHRITAGELAPGDVLLYASEHVVFFNGWADGSHTQYHAMEETRPGEGTVARVTPYPYWYSQSDFLPYRFNSVC